jgi:protein gp37
MFREYPRLKRFGLPTYRHKPDELHIYEDILRKPFEWKSPRMIFTNSMSDFFHEQIPFPFIDRVIEIMKSTPQHTYQILTKRSWRMMKYGERIGKFPDNVWLGVTVESAPYKFRIDHLRKTSCRTRFLSIEPLIAQLGSLDLNEIHWVIAGGESGPNHRPCRVEWVREVRDQCLRSGVPFFFKQWGGSRPKSGGRRLDRREWNEFPRVQSDNIAVKTILFKK